MGKLIPGKPQYMCKFWVFDTQCVTKKFSAIYIFPARQWKKYDLAKTGPNQTLTQLPDLHDWSLISSTGFPTSVPRLWDSVTVWITLFSLGDFHGLFLLMMGIFDWSPQKKTKNLALKDAQNWRSCSLTMWLSSVTEKNRIIIFTSTTMLQIDPKQKFLIAFYFSLAFLSWGSPKGRRDLQVLQKKEKKQTKKKRVERTTFKPKQIF